MLKEYSQDLFQAHVQPSRRQSGLVGRDQLTNGKAELNPVEVNRKALAELNTDEVNRRTCIYVYMYLIYPASDIPSILLLELPCPSVGLSVGSYPTIFTPHLTCTLTQRMLTT